MRSDRILYLFFIIITLTSCGGGRGGENSSKRQDETKSSIDSTLMANIISFEIKENKEKKKLIGSRSLGNATSNEVLNDNFAIANGEDKVVVILDVTTNCGCVTTSYDKNPIKKGEKRVIKYSYNTRGKSGAQFSEITIKTNIGNYMVLIDLNIN